MKIEARERGVCPGADVSVSLTKLLESLKTETEPCTVLFEKGVYTIAAKNLPCRRLHITNTVGDGEWKNGEVPHENRVGIWMENLHHVTLEGNGAEFLFVGQATHMALSQCSDITVRNLTLNDLCPDMHELEVAGSGLFWTDFRLDSESRYEWEKGQFYFTGEGYRTPFFDSRVRARWIGKMDGKEDGKLQRTNHPFFGAVHLQKRQDRLFRAAYLTPRRFRKGDRYVLFDVRRKYNGIFLRRCKEIALDHIRQHFNYGLALVAQDCDTLDFSHLHFAPREGGPRRMASVADFIQICMCRGQVRVRDSFFKGSGDDCLNAHGIHFKIVEKGKDSVTVRFMHPQSHGFNPLRPGDRIACVDPETLLCRGEAVVLSSELLDEYHIRLRLDCVEAMESGHAVEDLDASPDLVFERNHIDRVITRGLLVSVRGQVRIRENVLEHTSMNHILISDDARNWYESGCVRDVLIENNTFRYSPGHTVAIQPENRKYAGAVHRNIIIRNNSVCTPSYLIRSADGVEIYGNSNEQKEKVKIIHSDVNNQKGRPENG